MESPLRPNDPKIVLVIWRDACSEEAAMPHSEAVSGLVELREVGWLVAESEESVTLGMEIGDFSAPGRWRLHIPRVGIVRMVELGPKPKERKRGDKRGKREGLGEPDGPVPAV